MKRYEHSVGPVVVQRMPVIIRVDGKAFHTWTKQALTKNQDGPSEDMHQAMVKTAAELCEQVQNCVLAYTQSDEISLLLRDYDTIDTQQWFGGTVQKMASIAAAIATSAFNGVTEDFAPTTVPALFDARVFNVPKEDVANYFVWRQQDATRNSLNYIARQYFSHKQLQGKGKADVHEMLYQQHGINWNNYESWKKRGSCIKHNLWLPDQKPLLFSNFTEDTNTPIFSQERNYIEQHVYTE